MESTSPTLDVLGLGIVAVDDLLYVDEYPPADRKIRVRHRQRQCGGNTATALVAAARMGARCAYGGVLGDDELSQYVIETLHREGVDTSHGVVCDTAGCTHSTIVVDCKHNTRTIFSSVADRVGAHPRLPEAGVIRSAGVLLVDHHGLEGALRAVRIARSGGVHVVADFERDPGEPFGELAAMVDHLVVSARFAREMTGQADPATAARGLWNDRREAVVVTCGEAGCWYLDHQTRGTAQHHGALAVEVVDTTGCGDVFHGVYAATLARGMSLDQRVRWASAAAALKATRRGGQTGIPTTAAVERFLRQ